MELAWNGIHKEGASHIAQLLNSTSIVSSLWLLGNPIGDKGLQTIFDALKHNQSLKCLSVYACGMIYTGVASLADALHTNNTLETLDISLSKISPEGASYIAAVLNGTNVLSDLNMTSLPIGDKGLQTIFDALKRNKTLKVLNISKCGMTDTGVASLAYALRTNNTLEILYITGNEAITDNGLTCLVEAVSRHSRRLKELEIPKHLDVNEVRKIINKTRRRNGLPNINVKEF
jgi:Ran GTPase-activating protein (RanGAP) involved in mRNA processing and transport